MLEREVQEVISRLSSEDKRIIRQVIKDKLLEWKEKRVSKNELINLTLHKIKRSITKHFYEKGKKPTDNHILNHAQEIFRHLDLE